MAGLVLYNSKHAIFFNHFRFSGFNGNFNLIKFIAYAFNVFNEFCKALISFIIIQDDQQIPHNGFLFANTLCEVFMKSAMQSLLCSSPAGGSDLSGWMLPVLSMGRQ